jgi:hypothetical protein
MSWHIPEFMIPSRAPLAKQLQNTLGTRTLFISAHIFKTRCLQNVMSRSSATVHYVLKNPGPIPVSVKNSIAMLYSLDCCDMSISISSAITRAASRMSTIAGMLMCDPSRALAVGLRP